MHPWCSSHFCRLRRWQLLSSSFPCFSPGIWSSMVWSVLSLLLLTSGDSLSLACLVSFSSGLYQSSGLQHRLICLFVSSYARWQLLTRVGERHFTNSNFRAGYVVGAGYISFIWMLYPICWGLSEGGNKISPSSEMVFYGILDLMSGPVFLLAWMAHMSRFDTQTLASTSLGHPERGSYEEVHQQKPPQPQLEGAAPAPTAQNT